MLMIVLSSKKDYTINYISTNVYFSQCVYEQWMKMSKAIDICCGSKNDNPVYKWLHSDIYDEFKCSNNIEKFWWCIVGKSIISAGTPSMFAKLSELFDFYVNSNGGSFRFRVKKRSLFDLIIDTWIQQSFTYPFCNSKKMQDNVGNYVEKICKRIGCYHVMHDFNESVIYYNHPLSSFILDAKHPQSLSSTFGKAWFAAVNEVPEEHILMFSQIFK